jgi:outer membrane lipoprotein SlyB
MKHTHFTTSILLATLLAACAQHVPLIDTRAPGAPNDPARYQADLEDCQNYANSVAGPGTGAAVGAVGGALLGFLLGKAAGSRYDAPATARMGAVAGGAGGALRGADAQREVVSRCMAGRGYRVLQ